MPRKDLIAKNAAARDNARARPAHDFLHAVLGAGNTNIKIGKKNEEVQMKNRRWGEK